MDLFALKRASLGPHRWSRLLERYHEQHGNQALDSPISGPISTTLITKVDANWNRSIFFVPGGRFLIFAVNNTLELWDLGAVGVDEHAAPALLASTVDRDPPSTSKFNNGLLVQERSMDTLQTVAVVLDKASDLENLIMCVLREFPLLGLTMSLTDLQEKSKSIELCRVHQFHLSNGWNPSRPRLSALNPSGTLTQPKT